MHDTFGTRARLHAGDRAYAIARVGPLGEHLPLSLKILLENLLRHEDGVRVTADHVAALLGWTGAGGADPEVPFLPARVLLQDLTGVPAIADLAALRDAVAARGGDPTAVRPSIPVDLVVDHSVLPDAHGTPTALADNVEQEHRRNAERYRFLRWGQQAFGGVRIVPPGNGICHQVNLEHLARVVCDAGEWAFP